MIESKHIYSHGSTLARIYSNAAAVASLGWETEDGSAPEEKVLASPPPWSSAAVAGD